MKFLEGELPRRQHKTNWPWPKVAQDGRPAVFEYGQDWDDDGSADKVIQSARAWGYRRKYKVVTRIINDGDTCVVQFVRPGQEELV